MRDRNIFEFAGNDTIARMLSKRGKRQIRLIHLFKKAVGVVYKDVQKNKFKILCFASFPTTTMVATLAFIALGLTSQSREYRGQISQAISEPISYKLYTDYMSANFDGKHDIDTKKLRHHMIAQGKCHVIQDIFKRISSYPEGKTKRAIERNLKKRMTKGELTLV